MAWRAWAGGQPMLFHQPTPPPPLLWHTYSHGGVRRLGVRCTGYLTGMSPVVWVRRGRTLPGVDATPFFSWGAAGTTTPRRLLPRVADNNAGRVRSLGAVGKTSMILRAPTRREKNQRQAVPFTRPPQPWPPWRPPSSPSCAPSTHQQRWKHEERECERSLRRQKIRLERAPSLRPTPRRCSLRASAIAYVRHKRRSRRARENAQRRERAFFFFSPTAGSAAARSASVSQPSLKPARDAPAAAAAGAGAGAAETTAPEFCVRQSAIPSLKARSVVKQTCCRARLGVNGVRFPLRAAQGKAPQVSRLRQSQQRGYAPRQP